MCLLVSKFHFQSFGYYRGRSLLSPVASIYALFSFGQQPLTVKKPNCLFFNLRQIPNLHFSVLYLSMQFAIHKLKEFHTWTKKRLYLGYTLMKNIRSGLHHTSTLIYDVFKKQVTLDHLIFFGELIFFLCALESP